MKDLSKVFNSCLNCRNPRCVQNCPCGNNIPAVLAALKDGDADLASKTLRATNPFPEWTSLLCDHQRQCRGNCIRGIRGEAVDFPSVEYELSQEYAFPYQKGPSNGKRIAIVGAGPSALSCAVFLLSAGFDVDFYEKEASVGGAILTGIPAFRFSKESLEKAEENLKKLGAKFHFNTTVNQEMLKSLKEQYDEVILALGAEKENRLSTPACPDIHGALSLLADGNLRGDFRGLEKKSHIVVMGGGNVAMDVSRSLVRLGVKVTLIYRRDEASMPAQRHEIEEAKEDGVVFSPLTNVADYLLNDDGSLCGLRLVSMSLGEKDESGRPSFFTIEGSEHDVACDAFVMAIGEKSALSELADPENLGEKVHAIGDCSYGAKNIAAAIKSGRLAAMELIEKYR